jgi:spore germination protein KC
MVVALLVAALLLTTGCWDIREMNQLAMVMAVGIDKAEEPGRVSVTVQIARPSGEGRSGNASSGQGKSASVYIATADGDTLFSAIRNLAQFTSRRIMWAHNNVVVVGESLAREDLTPVIDFFTRNQELRMRTWIVVARNVAARAIVSAPTGMEDVPANSISALLRYAQLPGESVRIDISDVAAAYFAKDLYPVIPTMTLRNRALKATERPDPKALLPQADLAGSAIFRHARLIGYVERDAGRGLRWLRREMQNAAITVPCLNDPEHSIAMEIRSPKTNISTTVSGQVATFSVQVQTAAWVTEQDCKTPDVGTAAFKAYTEKALAKKIETEMRQTLTALQKEMKADGVKFGRLLHIQHPQWWRTNAKRWDELFPKAQTRFTITVKVQKMGLYTRPMGSKSP